MMIKFIAVRAGAVLTGAVLTAGTVLIAFSLCTVAHAKAPPQLATLKATAASFATLDRNADNQLSRTEAGNDRKLSNVFAYVDINGDGFISRDEYLALNEESPDAG